MRKSNGAAPVEGKRAGVTGHIENWSDSNYGLSTQTNGSMEYKSIQAGINASDSKKIASMIGGSRYNY